MKKLKLRIAKFNRMLVVEQLERTGEWENSEHVKTYDGLYLFSEAIALQENIKDKSTDCISFDDNNERDEYATMLIKWISEEQFSDCDELEIGKECLVSDNERDWYWHKRIFAGRIAKQLGLEKRFLTLSTAGDEIFECWKYAKPINTCFKIEGEIYTWEQK